MVTRSDHSPQAAQAAPHVDDVGPSNEASNVHQLPKPYVEVKLPDERLVRQCRASDSCPMSEGFIEKRTRMQEHLLWKHGLRVEIPKRQVGRPSNNVTSARPRRCLPHPYVDQWKRQADKRSLDEGKKLERNRREYKRLQYLLAADAWRDLCDEFKTSSKKDYILAWVKERMEIYMARTADRLARIRKQIMACARKRRFNSKDMPAWLQVVMDVVDEQEGHGSMPTTKDGSDGSDDVDDEEFQGNDSDRLNKEYSAGAEMVEEKDVDSDKEQHDGNQGDVSLLGALLGQKCSVQEEVSQKAENEQEDKQQEINAHETIKKRRKKLTVKSTRVLRSATCAVPIDIPSPTSLEKSTSIGLRYEIHNWHVSVHQTESGILTTPTTHDSWNRLESGMELDFIGMRSDILVGVNKNLVMDILIGEASTETLNLFAFTLVLAARQCFLTNYFSRVNLPRLSLCFFPVIYGRHWSLFVFLLNSNKRALKLKGNKHFLLYLDSLGLTNPTVCLDSLYGALKVLAESMANSSVQAAFLDPDELLELKTVEVPQQPNGIDCGFFVMAFTKYLISGILEKNMDKKMLTNHWFQHEDVNALRMDLNLWCHKALQDHS